MAQTPSAACCKTPPIVTQGYKEKGTWTNVDGLKTYATGPSSAKKGILIVYDIFGYFPQTLQGADILSMSDKDQQYKVFMPDLFEGKPMDISKFPPKTDEEKQEVGNFFNTTAAPPKHLERIPKVIDALLKDNPDISAWGVLGFCWGGKIVSLSSASGTKFKAAAAAHPAMVDPSDASKVTIPMLMLPSEGEDEKDVAAYEKELKVPHEIVWFKDQIHGFMAARGDLSNEKVVAAYEKGYQTVLSFFHTHLADSRPKM